VNFVKNNHRVSIAKVIGEIPYRLALAGGWIDQPFVSRHNPSPPGSIVVVSVEPQFRFMERSGMATGTRAVALQLWKRGLPKRAPVKLVRELYEAENRDKSNPSGSQDMIGLTYPGINRLDYNYSVNGGVFPSRMESIDDVKVERWLEKVIHLLPVAPRPAGYSPLGKKNFEPRWVARLGQSGKDCFEAIQVRDVNALGAAMNECMKCWERILPCTVRHPKLTVDLARLLNVYQWRYPGAMYSGCGGGYLLVASEEPVPGAFNIKIRVSSK
jgi:hypothetical protein